MDNNLAARIVQAVRDPGSIAPRNGHKESDDEWAARVVRYVLADAERQDRDCGCTSGGGDKYCPLHGETPGF